MRFAEILKELVLAVDGASGAIFLDTEGEAVQWYARSDPDRLRLRAAYVAVVVQAARSCSSRLDLGTLSGLVLGYEGAWLLVKEIDDGYFAVLELSNSANLAEAAARLSPVVTSLRQEIAA